MIKKIFRIGIVLGIVVALVWASGGVSNFFKSSTAYAAGDLTVDWGVPAGNPIFTINNSAPGAIETRNVTVTNSSTSPKPIAVRGILSSETASLSGVLDITISKGGTILYGPKTLAQFFADSAGPDGVPLETIAQGATEDYQIKLVFKQTAGNEFQNKSIVFDLKIGVAFSVPTACGTASQYGAPIFGTSGNDNIRGTNKKDLIVTFEGNDTIDGGNNDDCIVAGDGNKKIDGGNGSDSIVAGTGINIIDGGNGKDNIVSGSGNDKLEGGNEEDIINAGGGNDFVSGGNGQDMLFGEVGNDAIDGGNGKDTCVGEVKKYCEL